MLAGSWSVSNWLVIWNLARSKHAELALHVSIGQHTTKGILALVRRDRVLGSGRKMVHIFNRKWLPLSCGAIFGWKYDVK